MAKKQVETGLATSGAAFGAALLKEAQQANSEAMKKAVVEQVQNRLREIEAQRAFIQECQDREAFLQEQIRAIQGGAFTVERTGYIRFKDEALETYKRKGHAVAVPKCPKCGYSVNLMVSV